VKDSIPRRRRKTIHQVKVKLILKLPKTQLLLVITFDIKLTLNIGDRNKTLHSVNSQIVKDKNQEQLKEQVQDSLEKKKVDNQLMYAEL
jgi:hypothetical protein